ncbi:MAG: T9SS type A sorting domain-containing protein, partial [Bacteroidota bacterium]
FQLPSRGPASLKVFDAQGRMVQRGPLAPGESSWSLGSLPQGMYTIQVVQGAQQFIATVLKK